MNKQKYNGSAIVLTILGIAAMTTLTLGIAQLVPADFRQTQAFESTLAAENSAWGGIEHALLLLKKGQENNSFYELSDEYQVAKQANPTSPDPTMRPYGEYTVPLTNALNCFRQNRRDRCPGLDRQLGIAVNQTPVDMKVFNSEDTYYRLLVWHRRKNVGNINNNNINDFYPDTVIAQQYPEVTINPYLRRDEVRKINVDGTSQIRLRWKPIYNNNCVNNANAQYYLDYALIDSNGTITRPPAGQFPRVDNKGLPFNTETIGLGGSLNNIQTLSLRFLATSTNTVDNPATPQNEGGADEADISNCFMRYTIENLNPAETADLGFDVVEATGVSGGIRRKIRVIVNRENGNPLGIFDFSIACETCENI